ncbi:MAG: DNA (cytosine-5-)-methyltransferase [Tepidanaerobacteraceae bacterium]|nr:DNA (cytosine-5-)-methyltransferase [Bacteroidales bacterium]MDD4569514.1 DNA (cytosine-5-)-methyltransferase [Tepidanaerobacteraceae bacterium]
MKDIKIVELFAGVGGFRIGLEGASNDKTKYRVVWSSQWEPGAKKQHASDIYVARFGDKGHSCEDIQEVVDMKFDSIPNHDLLVGGFPCQDYSVARTLKQSKGLEGKKGVLWWSIFNILNKKGANAPKFLLLENVDRLLKSPVKQRGRDFAIMLSSLAKLGYAVEWRVINAADYGFPQRRRRIYIMGYKQNTAIWKKVLACKDKKKWINSDGLIAKAFKVKQDVVRASEFEISTDYVYVSEKFSKDMPSKSPFENAGVMINGHVTTMKVESDYKGKYSVLGDFIIDEKKVPEEFFIKPADIKRWEYLKGGKKEERKSSSGHEYNYSEGPMAFPDPLDKPSRTIITGEGGTSPSRFKHVIKTKSGRLRRLMPIELERLNMFPDNHTKIKETPDIKRAFIMGNALVVGVIKKLGESLRDAV